MVFFSVSIRHFDRGTFFRQSEKKGCFFRVFLILCMFPYSTIFEKYLDRDSWVRFPIFQKINVVTSRRSWKMKTRKVPKTPFFVFLGVFLFFILCFLKKHVFHSFIPKAAEHSGDPKNIIFGKSTKK
jgi:hypothetical protein